MWKWPQLLSYCRVEALCCCAAVEEVCDSAVKGTRHPTPSLALVPDALPALGLHACFLPPSARPRGDPQHICSGLGFFPAITGVLIKHFMHVNSFSFSEHFHWTRFTRSKNCCGSTEVSGGKLTPVCTDLS